MFGKIGRITPADVGTNPLRADHLGGLIVSGSKYKDTTLAGKHYFAYCAGQAVELYSEAALVVGLQVYNPPDSGVNLVWNKWSVIQWDDANNTGMVLAISAQVTVPGTAPATLTGQTLLTGSTGLSAGLAAAYSESTITTAPVIVWPLFHDAALIAVTGAEVIGGDFGGTFGSAPGTVTVMGALGADGVTIDLGITWEEVPIGL